MRKPSVGFHPAAAREYADALEWYAARGEALGSVFQQEVERAIRLILRRRSDGLASEFGTGGSSCGGSLIF